MMTVAEYQSKVQELDALEAELTQLEKDRLGGVMPTDPTQQRLGTATAQAPLEQPPVTASTASKPQQLIGDYAKQLQAGPPTAKTLAEEITPVNYTGNFAHDAGALVTNLGKDALGLIAALPEMAKTAVSGTGEEKMKMAQDLIAFSPVSAFHLLNAARLIPPAMAMSLYDATTDKTTADIGKTDQQRYEELVGQSQQYVAQHPIGTLMGVAMGKGGIEKMRPAEAPAIDSPVNPELLKPEAKAPVEPAPVVESPKPMEPPKRVYKHPYDMTRAELSDAVFDQGKLSANEVAKLSPDELIYEFTAGKMGKQRVVPTVEELPQVAPAEAKPVPPPVETPKPEMVTEPPTKPVVEPVPEKIVVGAKDEGLNAIESKQREIDAAKTPESSTPKTVSQPEPVTSAPAELSFLDKAEAAARERLAQRQGKISLGALGDPKTALDLTDHAIIGAVKLARGVGEFGQWSAEMLKEFGDEIKPHLQKIWRQSRQFHEKIKAGEDPATFVVEQPKVENTGTAPVEVGLSKEHTAELRQAYGLDQIDQTKARSFLDAAKTAKDKGLDKDALSIANDVMATKRPITMEEHAGLHAKALDLANEYDKAIETSAKLVDEGNPEGAAIERNRANAIAGDIDRLTLATDLGTGEAARTVSIARMMQNREDFSISASVQKAKSLKGEPLTPKETSRIEELALKHKEYERQIEDLRAKNDQLMTEHEKEVAAAVAKRMVRRERITAKTTEYKSKILKERDSIKKQIADLGYRVNDVTGVTAEGSYLIGKLAVNYIKEGAVNLADVVQKVIADIPALTDRDVYQALIAKDPKRQGIARNEVTQRIRQLRKEASLMAGDKLAEVKSELARLEEQRKTGDFEVKPKTEATKLSPELERKQIELLMVRRELRTAINQVAPTGVRGFIDKSVNTLRTAKATADISATFRQGLVENVNQGLKHPVRTLRKNAQAIKAMFSEFTAEQIDNEIRTSPTYYQMQKAKLQLSDMDGKLSKQEEYFASNWLEKVPVVKAIVRASDRHMTTLLNSLRSAAFDDFLAKYPNATDAQLASWADYINKNTGKGNLGSMAQAANELSLAFFAPKFAVSRIQTPLALFKNLKDPILRKEIALSYARVIGVGLTAIGIAKLAGAKTSSDPDSADFGKIRYGDTRVDIWGGFQQPARLLSRIAIGVYDRVSGKEKVENPLELITQFATYKMGPGTSLPLELYRGKTIMGEPVTLTETAAAAVTPMVLADFYDAWKDQEAASAIVSGAMSATGIGVSTYTDKKNRKKNRK